MEINETREYLDEALEEFRESEDSDNKLRNLQKISQLVEVTTDEELYELASATVAAEDYRLRGEICYTISRSQRPQLVPILRDMAQDENSYVRRAAIKALDKIGGVGEATFSAINPVLSEVEKLRETLTRLEGKINQLNQNLRNFNNSSVDVSNHIREVVMDDYEISWETYLRYEREFLRDHKDKYVAIYKKDILGIGEDEGSLAEAVYEKYGLVEALICKIEEEGEPIQMPPPREIIA